MKRGRVSKGVAVSLSVLMVAAMVPVFLLLASSSAVSASPAWWNESWPYRRKITISGAHPENFQIMVVIPSDIPKSMFPSIRFIEDETGDPLPYWIERNEGSYLNVAWVRRLENKDDSIYMYYGNPYATSAENGDDVFLFFDDFGGNALNTAKWGRSSTGVDVFQYTLRLEDWGNQEAFVEHGPEQGLSTTEMNTRRIIEWRIKNASTWRGGVGLQGPGWGFKEMAMIFKDDGNFRFFADGTYGTKTIEGDKWYVGQIILYGANKKRINVNFYYGNDNVNYRQLVENVRDYEFGDWAPESGGWYIDKYRPRVWDGGGTSSYYYDWFLVRKYNELGPDPVTTVGSEESNPTVGYLSASASISEYPFPPEVLSISPETTSWTPYTWTTVTVTVRDNNMNLENIYLMAYEGSLDNTAPDSTRNHYTWLASKSTGSWQFSCPLGGAYIDTTGCSVTEDSNARTYTAVFKVRVAKTAAPGTWDLYARGVDATNNEGYLESAGAVTVQVYFELSLSTNTLTFVGMQGESVYASQSPMTVTVTSNQNFSIKVKAAGDWTSDGNTIQASQTKAIGDATVSLSTTYQDVYTNISYGEGVTRQIQWRLDIPADAVPGTYTNTFYVKVE